MKIDYSKKINTLAGKPYQVENGVDLTLGDIVAEALATDQTGGKMKLYSLAQTAFKKGVSEVDSADLVLIKKAVADCKSYNGNALILGQSLELLEEVK